MKKLKSQRYLNLTFDFTKESFLNGKLETLFLREQFKNCKEDFNEK